MNSDNVSFRHYSLVVMSNCHLWPQKLHTASFLSCNIKKIKKYGSPLLPEKKNKGRNEIRIPILNQNDVNEDVNLINLNHEITPNIHLLYYHNFGFVNVIFLFDLLSNYFDSPLFLSSVHLLFSFPRRNGIP